MENNGLLQSCREFGLVSTFVC